MLGSVAKKVTRVAVHDMSGCCVARRRVWGNLIADSTPARLAADRLSLPPQGAGVLLAVAEEECLNVAAAAGKTLKGVMRDARKFLVALIDAWHPNVAPGARRKIALDLAEMIKLHPHYRP